MFPKGKLRETLRFEEKHDILFCYMVVVEGRVASGLVSLSLEHLVEQAVWVNESSPRIL